MKPYKLTDEQREGLDSARETGAMSTILAVLEWHIDAMGQEMLAGEAKPELLQELGYTKARLDGARRLVRRFNEFISGGSVTSQPKE